MYNSGYYMYYVTLIAEYNNNVTFSLLPCSYRHDVKIVPVQMHCKWLRGFIKTLLGCHTISLCYRAYNISVITYNSLTEILIARLSEHLFLRQVIA